MNKRFLNLGVIIGTLGTIAGIGLLIMGEWLIGGSGTVASAGLAYFSYQNAKKQEYKTD
jgi:ABC-type transport system involved in cytochrome bd biosynthesis fused ATPase/permease subunit